MLIRLYSFTRQKSSNFTNINTIIYCFSFFICCNSKSSRYSGVSLIKPCSYNSLLIPHCLFRLPIAWNNEDNIDLFITTFITVSRNNFITISLASSLIIACGIGLYGSACSFDNVTSSLPSKRLSIIGNAINNASLMTLLKLLYSGYSIILSICLRLSESQILMCLSTDFSTSFLFNFTSCLSSDGKRVSRLSEVRERQFAHSLYPASFFS